jgi:hypothetical protein
VTGPTPELRFRTLGISTMPVLQQKWLVQNPAGDGIIEEWRDVPFVTVNDP